MGATITQAGENLIAQKQGAQQVLNITRFIFANVPGLDHTAPINRAAPKPPAAQIVHQHVIPAEHRGYVNPSQVVYSAQIGSDVGDWDFNWIGLETAEGVLFAVSTVALQQKRRNIPPIQVGNNLTRNFLVVFDGAQALTGITIDAATWQHDFTVRLAGIDERERQSNRDIYGRACFFGSSLQLEKVGAAYRLKPGTAYIEGIRLHLAAVQPVAPPALPTTAWADVSLQRELSDVVASWNIAWGAGKTDYVDSAGVQHYLVQIAELPSSTVINDLRSVEAIDSTLLDFINTKEPSIATGTTAQYRRGDKTWRDFATDVRATVLAGLSTATATAALATDTLLVALGKLQAQINLLNTSKLNATANAVSASKLATARTINGTAFDGSANIVTTNWGTARTVTIGATGKSVNGAGNVTWSLAEILPAGVSAGYVLAAPSDVAGPPTFRALTATDIPALNQDTTGNAATATRLAVARLIGGVSFDGTANIALPGVNAPGNQSTTGNAATATRLATARTIGGVAFDGTANITLPGVNAAGNQSTTGNAATATRLATGRTITLSGAITGSTSFDGSGNVTINATATQATELLAGGAKVATQEETDSGTDDMAFITPRKLRWGFAASFGTTGFIALPSWLGGFIRQWGTVTVRSSGSGLNQVVTVTLPVTFPNAAYNAQVSVLLPDGAVTGSNSPFLQAMTQSTLSIGLDGYGSSDRDYPTHWSIIGR